MRANPVEVIIEVIFFIGSPFLVSDDGLQTQPNTISMFCCVVCSSRTRIDLILNLL